MNRFLTKLFLAFFGIMTMFTSAYAILPEKSQVSQPPIKSSKPKNYVPPGFAPKIDNRVSIEDSPYTKDRYLYKARRAFAVGNFEYAYEMVGKSLRVYKSNKPAQILKDKLDAVKADLDKEKLNMAKEYCQNASHLFRKGLVLEAMLDVKKSLLLDPNSIETRNLDDKILSSIKSITDKVNEDYRKKFRQAIEYFIDGNIEKSEKYFRMLENQTDSADYFLPIVISHHSDKSNYDRSNLYYEEALNQLNETRYAMAKESLMLALRLDKDNLDARLLLTLVKELELAAE